MGASNENLPLVLCIIHGIWLECPVVLREESIRLCLKHSGGSIRQPAAYNSVVGMKPIMAFSR